MKIVSTMTLPDLTHGEVHGEPEGRPHPEEDVPNVKSQVPVAVAE